MACEVNDKEINSQCAELLVRPSYDHGFSARVATIQPTRPDYLTA